MDHVFQRAVVDNPGDGRTLSQLAQHLETRALMDQLSSLQPEHPKVIDLAAEALKVSIEEMPVINLFLGSKLIVFDTYVWENWPTAYKHAAREVDDKSEIFIFKCASRSNLGEKLSGRGYGVRGA